MTRQLICFRFDVDTPRCLTHGMPVLLDLAKELDVRFTFYVNPGRAVLRRELLKRGNPRQTVAPKLSGLRKLGFVEYVRVATRNPVLSRIDRDHTVERAVAEGHEVGLHGGHNHAEWQRYAHTWSEDKVRAEIEFGLDALKGLGVGAVSSFASPGWNTPPGLAEILPEYGINILADRHGLDPHTTDGAHTGHTLQVSTAFTGEPGGVGYLEWLTAQGLDNEQSLSHFATQLDAGSEQYVALYDHPCFAGIEGLPLLRMMVTHCHDAGVKVLTFSECARFGNVSHQ